MPFTATQPPTTPRDARDLDAHRLLGIHAHAWVLANINMADNKAAFIVFGAAALAAYLRPEVSAWLAAPGWEPGMVLRAAAMALLVLGTACAVVVVAPRARGRGRSLTYWGGIAEHRDAADYADAVEARSAQELGRVLLEQCYVVAGLAARKFAWLRLAVWLTGAGFVLALAGAVLP